MLQDLIENTEAPSPKTLLLREYLRTILEDFDDDPHDGNILRYVGRKRPRVELKVPVYHNRIGLLSFSVRWWLAPDVLTEACDGPPATQNIAAALNVTCEYKLGSKIRQHMCTRTSLVTVYILGRWRTMDEGSCGTARR